MRTRSNHRSTLFVHAALAGVLFATPALSQPSGNTINAPAPGSTESYSGSLAELATGVKSTPPQPDTIQSPRDATSGQIMQDYYAHSNLTSPRDPASGQATGRRQHEPLQIMAGPGDGADGPPAQVQAGANSWLDGSFDIAGRNATNPNQGASAGASAPGRAMTDTANAIDITNTDAGPPKPSAPTVSEPGAVKKNPSRRRPRTRKPAS